MGDIDNLMPKIVYQILHGLCHQINDIAGLRGQARRQGVKGVTVSRGPVISGGPAAKRLKIHIII
jgi:hypothetical protein